MFIAKENVLSGTSPSVISGVGTDLSSNMTNSDHSLVYTTGNSITVQFFALFEIDYFALSGLNLGGSTVRITNGTDFSIQVEPERNNVIMFVFERRSFSALQLQITIPKGNIVISHVSAGKAMQIPNGGVTSGHSRQWLNRNYKARTITSNIGAPIASLLKREALKGSLKLPNMPNDFVRGDWQEFSDFASTGEVFYITEQADILDPLPESSYACFSPVFSAPTAHPLTTEIQNINFRFNVYNGL